MDVHYKTYAGRSNRDIRFDQLLHTKPLSGSSSTTFSKSSVSSRKRVNVVSFVPTGEGQELITKSPDKIVSENSDSSAYAGAVQTNISQPFLSHSSTEGVTTGSPILSYSSRPPVITVTDNNSSDYPSDCTFDVRSIRSSNPKSDQYRSDITITPTSTMSSHTTIQRVSSPNSQRSITNHLSHSLCTSKPASQLRLQRIDKSQTNLVVTISNNSLKSQTFLDIPKNSRERSLPYSFPTSTSEPEVSSDAGASKSFSRPLLSGKSKRAAYNPRSWQKEIETEDSSSTKLQKINESSACSPNHTQSSIDSYHLSVKNTSSSTNQEDCNMKLLSKRVNKTDVDKFTFDDFEEEEEVHTEGLKNNSLHSYKYTNSNHHPRHRSVKHADDDGDDGDDKLVEDDEDLEEDVKPWFRPASRDNVSSKKLSNSSSAKDVRVSRTEKPLYTVLHKVKEAHVCQEQGETQHLLDDVEYLVDGLTDRNQINTRALSVLTLANKCLTASFRYALNAHGLLKRICAKLHDAYTDYVKFASERLGACSGFLETIFDCLLKLPDRLPGTKRFDVIVLVLCLLVNMCEHCPENRTRIVYLDITKSCLKQGGGGSPSKNPKEINKYMDTYDDEEEDNEDDDDDDDDDADENNANGSSSSRQIVTTSALDELIQLFLTREECARNHDFERDDDDDEAIAAAAARKRSQEELEDIENNSKQLRPGYPNPTVEEAGLKWRLIEDRRAMNLHNRGGFLGNYC
ncbi:unnamed protein product [Schistosoma turkestanicum]|nr:unnamed protein product [Schistosoma turkestanicum]